MLCHHDDITKKAHTHKHPYLSQELNIRLALLTNVEPHTSILNQVRLGSVIKVENIRHNTLVNQNHQGRLSDPLITVLSRFSLFTVKITNIEETVLVLSQTLEMEMEIHSIMQLLNYFKGFVVHIVCVDR